MASRVPTQPVYQKGFQPKRPRVEVESHLVFIRRLICCCCFRPAPFGGSNDPMHIRSANAFYGHRGAGGGETADDKWTLPGCRRCHEEQHSEGDEMAFWAHKRINPHLLALVLWACTGNEFVAEELIRLHRGHGGQHDAALTV
jgi:hypothetical protein